MTSRAFSALSLRVLGLCLFIGGALVAPKIFFWHRALMAGQTGPTPLYLTGTAQNRIMVVRDAVYTEQQFTPAFITTALALFLGLFLVIFARPIARLAFRDDETQISHGRSA